MNDSDKFFDRLEQLLVRVEKLLPAAAELKTDAGFRAYRWSHSALEGIALIDEVDSAELLHLERQKKLMSKNTAQFVAGKPANNALLWGARGTGKSSLIKAQLHEFKDQGLCIVESTPFDAGVDAGQPR